MKIFISSDIEGVNGIASWSEADRKSGSEYEYFAARMTDEAAAVCQGINDLDENAYIMLKDAHGSGRNIDHAKLPENVKLVRGWPGRPASMVNCLDNTFDAAMFIGYHSPAFTAGNPLAHTINSQKYLRVTLNGQIIGEFHFSYYAALSMGVPVAMVSGDKRLTELARETDGDIITVATLEGFGGGVISGHPNLSQRELRSAAKEAAGKAAGLKTLIPNKLPKSFRVEITYKRHKDAFFASNFPGMFKVDDMTVGYECTDFFQFLRAWSFV